MTHIRRIISWAGKSCLLALLIALVCGFGYMAWRVSELEAGNARLYQRWERTAAQLHQLSAEKAALGRRVEKAEKDLVHARAARQPVARISRTFPIQGAKTVILRAADAGIAEVKKLPGSTEVVVSGFPVGGAKGYHSPDPDWTETPPERWGLDFKSEVQGTALVISATREISYIHHHYQLTDIELVVPPGIEIVKEPRGMSRTGEPPAPPPPTSPSPDKAAELQR